MFGMTYSESCAPAGLKLEIPRLFGICSGCGEFTEFLRGKLVTFEPLAAVGLLATVLCLVVVVDCWFETDELARLKSLFEVITEGSLVKLEGGNCFFAALF